MWDSENMFPIVMLMMKCFHSRFNWNNALIFFKPCFRAVGEPSDTHLCLCLADRRVIKISPGKTYLSKLLMPTRTAACGKLCSRPSGSSANNKLLGVLSHSSKKVREMMEAHWEEVKWRFLVELIHRKTSCFGYLIKPTNQVYKRFFFFFYSRKCFTITFYTIQELLQWKVNNLNFLPLNYIFFYTAQHNLE